MIVWFSLERVILSDGEGDVMEIVGRTALVSGGGSGIGAAGARQLAARGASRVVVADIDAERANEVAQSINGVGLGLDVADPNAWQAVADIAPDIAFLNAGVTAPVADLGDFPARDYERIRAVNVDGVVWGIRAVVPGMRRAGRGAIIMTSSVAGLVPHDGDPFYTMTKHALIGLMRATAPRLSSNGVIIGCVCPGLVATPMADATVQARRDAGADPLPSLQPEDIA